MLQCIPFFCLKMPQCDPINSGRKYHNETFFLNDHIETLKDHIEILKKKESD